MSIGSEGVSVSTLLESTSPQSNSDNSLAFIVRFIILILFLIAVFIAWKFITGGKKGKVSEEIAQKEDY